MYRLKFHVVNRVSDISLRQLMFIVFLLAWRDCCGCACHERRCGGYRVEA